MSGIRCPVIAFLGRQDQRLMEALPAFTEAMATHARTFESHVYDGAGHAFFNDERGSYHAPSARDAFIRTLRFLQGILGS